MLLQKWLAGGFLLWQRRSLGYVCGASLLFIGSTLFTGQGFVHVFSALYGGSTVDWIGVIMMIAMGVLCLVPFALFLRGAASSTGQGPA